MCAHRSGITHAGSGVLRATSVPDVRMGSPPTICWEPQTSPTPPAVKSTTPVTRGTPMTVSVMSLSSWSLEEIARLAGKLAVERAVGRQADEGRLKGLLRSPPGNCPRQAHPATYSWPSGASSVPGDGGGGSEGAAGGSASVWYTNFAGRGQAARSSPPQAQRPSVAQPPAARQPSDPAVSHAGRADAQRDRHSVRAPAARRANEENPTRRRPRQSKSLPESGKASE